MGLQVLRLRRRGVPQHLGLLKLPSYTAANFTTDIVACCAPAATSVPA